MNNAPHATGGDDPYSQPLNPDNFKVVSILAELDEQGNDTGRHAHRVFTHYVTTIGMPTIGIQPVALPYKGMFTYEAGNTIEYGELTLSFLAGEYLQSYIDIVEWITNNAAENLPTLFADMTIVICDSNNQPAVELNYKKAFPINISGLEMTSSSGAVNYAKFDVTFRYDTADIIPVGGPNAIGGENPDASTFCKSV